MSNKEKRFAEAPSNQPHLLDNELTIEAGSWDTRLAVKAEMAEGIKCCKKLSRWQIAAEVSRRVGHDVTKGMIDNYTAESKEEYFPPFFIMAAFCAVTEYWGPMIAALSPAGADIVFGKEKEMLDDLKSESRIRELMQKENERRLKAGKPPIEWGRK